MKLKLTDIIILRELSPHKTFSEQTIEPYMQITDDLPPIVVHKKTLVLIDGFYRMFRFTHFLENLLNEIEFQKVTDESKSSSRLTKPR